MSTVTATGVARPAGSAKGAVRDGEQAVAWTGEATLFHLQPALAGFDAGGVHRLRCAPRALQRRHRAGFRDPDLRGAW